MRTPLLALGLLLLALGLALPGWLLIGTSVNAGEVSTGPSYSRNLEAVDDSGNGHHGVIQGSPRTGVAGHSGTAYSFVSTGSYVQVSPDPALNPGTRDFMMSAWVNFRDVPGVDETYDIIRKGVADTLEGDYKLELVDPGGVRCTMKDSDRREARATTFDVDVSDGRWHYVACARTGSHLTVIADDAMVSKRAPLGWVGNTMPLAIGSKYGWEDQSDGRLDQVMIVMDGASTDDARPSTLRDGIRHLRTQPPTGLWNFEEGAGTAKLVDQLSAGSGG